MNAASGREFSCEHQFDPSFGAQTNDDDTRLIVRTLEALNIAHSSSSSKEARRDAFIFLDQIKYHEQAPSHGFNLASDATQQPTVRHYALSLLEYVVKYKWREYSEIQKTTLREWVIQLARCIQPSDPIHLRNKIAQLWVEVAKRSWCSTWKDMDELLVIFWNMPNLIHKELLLSILETLSEEIFGKEDSAIIMRNDALQKGCVEIFAPAVTFYNTFPKREISSANRCGEEGWLMRVGEFLDYILINRLYEAPDSMKCVVRILSVYKSVMTWIFPSAISSTSCVHYMIKTLAVSNIGIQLVSVEALNSLYSRPHFTDEDFMSLICPILTHEKVDLLCKLFEWSCVDPRDIDEEKYLFSKKFSEMILNLGGLVEKKIDIIPKDCDLPTLFNLLFNIAQNPSFLVSIPILLLWSRILQSDKIFEMPATNPLIAPLLELAGSRLIRYDLMPEDFEDSSMILLLEDIDTIPERNAFLSNYRHICIQLIELIVYKKHSEAIHHLLSQAELLLRQLYDNRAELSVENYSKYSLSMLKSDAQFSMIEAALKGYIKWRSSAASKSQQDEQNQENIENYMEAWCERLLAFKFEDPIIRKRVLQTCVVFSTSALDQKNNLMLKILEQILTNRVLESPEHIEYSEAVKEMHVGCLIELQRLALKMPDQLLDVYEQLERIVNEIISSGTIDVKSQVAFQTFLFTIIHRNTKLEPETCSKKLLDFIGSVQTLWQDPNLDQALSSFDSFCDILGIDKVKKYLKAKKVHQIEDWSLFKLDEEGRIIQRELEERSTTLPLRTTKCFMQCSTDRLDMVSPKLQIARRIWKNLIPIILPKLLNFLRYAHGFHNPENWTGLPPEMAPVVTRILSDRFWQAGISEGSKEDFYAHVSGTKSTMEGLASSIRASVRMIRENTYGIFHCLSRFDIDFYGYSELPGPLAHSLFVDAHYLSPHHYLNLLQVVRLLISDCPIELRVHFVSPLLATCYSQLDLKCTMQWEKLTARQNAAMIGENLTDEMKEESLLRQITYAAVVIIGDFLDPSKSSCAYSRNRPALGPGSGPTPPSMREFCLSSPSIMEPVLTFLSHAIGMRDTRSCATVLRIFQSIIPEFSIARTKGKGDTEFMISIREFISLNVLMACISSLNGLYFVDLQKDLVQCIVSILVYYCEESTTPRQVLLNIPKIEEGAVDRCLQKFKNSSVSARQQRALILDLLNDIKGVSISEQGRISKSASTARKERSKMHQDFMKLPSRAVKDPGSPVLEFVAGIFNE